MDDTPLYPFFGDTRLLVFAHDYAAGSLQACHRHDVPQLLHAMRGVMRMTTPEGYWVIPPGRGVWIPAFMPHEIRMVGPVSMRTLYVGAALDQAAVTDCAVVDVPPLLQHLLDELAGLDSPEAHESRHRVMEELVLIEVTRLRRIQLHVRIPGDARLRKLCNMVLAHPEDGRTFDDLALHTGATARTLRRLFQQDIGMSFAAWRQQVRLVEALARLAEGQVVAKVSRELGYSTPSAFTAMFKRMMGCSPRIYADTDAPWATEAQPSVHRA